MIQRIRVSGFPGYPLLHSLPIRLLGNFRHAQVAPVASTGTFIGNVFDILFPSVVLRMSRTGVESCDSSHPHKAENSVDRKQGLRCEVTREAGSPCVPGLLGWLKPEISRTFSPRDQQASFLAQTTSPFLMLTAWALTQSRNLGRTKRTLVWEGPYDYKDLSMGALLLSRHESSAYWYT